MVMGAMATVRSAAETTGEEALADGAAAITGTEEESTEAMAGDISDAVRAALIQVFIPIIRDSDTEGAPAAPD
jgi:hypothetical protein